MVEKLTGWQAIETAPTEHLARFLIYVTPRSDTEQTIYEAKRYNDQWADHIRLNDGYGSHNEYSILARATHWQPLPAPPGTTRAPADLRSGLEAETIERAARAMCVHDGLDPDEHIIGGQATGFEDYGPLWQAEQRSEGQLGITDYAGLARAALAPTKEHAA